MKRCASTWSTFEVENSQSWSVLFDGTEVTPEVARFQRIMIDAGETNRVYRVQRIPWFGFERSRNGYLGSYLDANPAVLTADATAEVPGSTFGAGDQIEATSELTTLSVDCTESVTETDTVLYIAEAAGIIRPAQTPPVSIWSLWNWSESKIHYVIALGCSIWYPWTFAGGEYQDPVDEPIDNRYLAQKNTPRLNAFFRDVRLAAEAAGSTLRLEKPYRNVAFELDDHGIILDAMPPDRV